MLFIHLYLIQLLIRPQDFSPLFLGLPTAWLIVFPGFIVGALKNFSFISSNRLPQCYMLIAFLGLIFVTTFWNVGVSEALDQANLFLKRIVAFFMIIMLVDTEKKLKSTLLMYVILAASLGVHTILQLKTGFGFNELPPLTHYDPPRAVWLGVWDGSNSFGVIFITAIPLCLEFMLGRYSLLTRVIGVLSLSLVFAGLFNVDSRGDILGAMLALVCFAVMKFSKKTNLILLVMAVLFVGALLPSRMSEVSTSEESAHQRTWVWEQGIGLLIENPLLGVGAGQFVKNTSSGLVAHSNYVAAFSEWGLIGFFIFLSLCWLSLKTLLNVYLSGLDPGLSNNEIISQVDSIDEKSEAFKGIARALFASLSGLYTATFFIVFVNDLLFFFWAMCGSLWIIASKDNNDKIEFLLFDKMFILVGMVAIIGIIWYISIIM